MEPLGYCDVTRFHSYVWSTTGHRVLSNVVDTFIAVCTTTIIVYAVNGIILISIKPSSQASDMARYLRNQGGPQTSLIIYLFHPFR